ncbi:MAG: FAD-dependent oxidoreductase [Pseudomonadota bacterium]
MEKGREKFPHLFSKGRFGKFETKNRVKYAACCISNFNNPDGSYTEREYARDEVISRMGCGILTNQGAYPDRKGEGKGYSTQICINDDKFIPGLSRVSELFHREGALAIQQILHAGRYGGMDLDYCLQSSETPQTLRHFRPPRAMTKDEIQQAVQDHADAAVRALKAGFDGVEITSFMGYLLSSFLSKFVNKRTDEYGGSLENRGRFMVESIRAIKKAMGQDKLLCIRLNGTELMDEYDGSTEEECVEFMKMAEDAGADMISMVIGWHESRSGALGRDIPLDGWLYLAENARKQINVPLAFGPRLADPVMAEKAIAEGVIDFWEVCRPFLADPLLLRKVEEDRLEEIKPCIGCMMCLARLFANQPYICTVNPVLGHEVEPEYRVVPAVRRKKIIIIGGGPAGMECAATASRRGHDVRLFEKRGRLGGQVLSAVREIKGSKDLKRMIKYYENELKARDIRVELGRAFDRDLCRKERPDVIVIATGAGILKPDIPGIDRENVLFAWDVLESDAPTSDRVVVIGGGKVGLVAAEHLASEGKEVWLVEPRKRVDYDISPTFKWRHASWVKEFGIHVMNLSRALEVTEKGLVIRDGDGRQRLIEAGTAVLAGPRISMQDLSEELEYLGDEIYMIGDAVKPRSIHNAIHEGYKLGVRM